jgi:hypothetical protein
VLLWMTVGQVSGATRYRWAAANGMKLVGSLEAGNGTRIDSHRRRPDRSRGNQDSYMPTSTTPSRPRNPDS